MRQSEVERLVLGSVSMICKITVACSLGLIFVLLLLELQDDSNYTRIVPFGPTSVYIRAVEAAMTMTI